MKRDLFTQFMDPPKPTAKLLAIVAEVAQKLKMAVPAIEIQPDLRPIQSFDPSYSGAGVNYKPSQWDKEGNPTAFQAYIVMIFAQGIEDYLELDKLKSIIAHEFGHIAHHDSARQAEMARASEISADEFAARSGYGDGLVELFSERSEFDRDPLPPEWQSHPGYDERIQAIRAEQKRAK